MIQAFEPPDTSFVTSGQRFILAQLDRLILVLPANLVLDTLLIRRFQILSMPFYPAAILGCLHHGGELVPLVNVDRLLGIATGLTREQLTVIRLGESAEKFAGVGLVVDRVLGTQMGEQLPPELFEAELYFPDTENGTTFKLFHPQLLNSEMFVPLRWVH
ncbi:MAG: chemotaxis protein CheW [Hydrococcus sp. RM1_1_31]|nr:chemotaxis protein CheW [Hydrococcus sp. RM1_1_31]